MKQRFDGKYLHIVFAEKVGRTIRVSFKNGDVVEVPIKDLKLKGYKNVDWNGPFIEIDGLYISFKASPMDFEVPGYVIRRATDPKFARCLEQAEKKQNRYIGRRIRKLRTERCLSLAEVARKSKLKEGVVRGVEKGVLSGRYSVLERILSAMNCSFANLGEASR